MEGQTEKDFKSKFYAEIVDYKHTLAGEIQESEIRRLNKQPCKMSMKLHA